MTLQSSGQDLKVACVYTELKKMCRRTGILFKMELQKYQDSIADVIKNRLRSIFPDITLAETQSIIHRGVKLSDLILLKVKVKDMMVSFFSKII